MGEFVGHEYWVPILYGIKDQEGRMTGWVNRTYLSEDEDDHCFLKEMIDHIVVEGDTLFNLSQRYDRSIQEIMKWDALQEDDQLQIGQRLRILQKIKENHEYLSLSRCPCGKR